MLSVCIEEAKRWDQQDVLKAFRDKFYIPQVHGKDCIYLCGNSLGLRPKTSNKYLDQDMQDWADLGVEGHFKGKSPWFHYHKFLTEASAEIVGAKNDEVVVMNQLSVNLHLLLSTFYKPTEKRYKIIMEAGAFPSDMYVIESQLRLNNIGEN